MRSLLGILLFFAPIAFAQNPPAAKKKPNVANLYFPNDRVIRGELISMTGLSVSIDVDGKIETYNPALSKLLAVQTKEGWHLFDPAKKTFVSATADEVQRVLGKTAMRQPPEEKPASRSSGPVLLVNTNKETIRITTKSFIDGQGNKHILVKTIDVKPGESDLVDDLQGKAIRASQISFTLTTKNGSSEWSAGLKEFDGTSVQVVISGDQVMTASTVEREREARVLGVMKQIQDQLFEHYFQAWSGKEKTLKSGDSKPGDAAKDRRKPASFAEAPAEFKKSREAKLMDAAGTIAVLFVFAGGTELHDVAVKLPDQPRYRSYFQAIRSADQQGRDGKMESILAATFADMIPEHRKELFEAIKSALTDKEKAGKQFSKDDWKKQLDDRSPALAMNEEAVDLAHQIASAALKNQAAPKKTKNEK